VSCTVHLAPFVQRYNIVIHPENFSQNQAALF
jgi:hypothetical protein